MAEITQNRNQGTAHRHHHHRHHRRRHYQRMGFQQGIVYGLAVVAGLCTLLILFFGITERDNLRPVLLRLLPFFSVAGALVGGLNYYLVMKKYKAEFEG